MSQPVITVTLNPAIDFTVTLPALRPGEVNLASGGASNAGGKGVNVASCLADWGAPVIATGLLGKHNSESFEALFRDKGIADRFIRVGGDTRVNIKLADSAGGGTTDINLPGLSIEERHWDKLLTVLAADTNPDSLIVLAGSLPNGLPTDSYARLTGKLRQWGARVVLDTSGPALSAALAAPREALPHCIKPNRQELAQWVGKPLADTAEVLTTARQLQAAGVAQVVVSLGEDGALFVLDTGPALLARLPVQNPVSTVGAGDALVAGLCAGLRQNLSPERCSRLAVAFASAKLAAIGPHLPSPDTVQALADSVHIETL